MKIISVIPYAFFPPMNGGALRCFYMLNELAKRHDVHVLTVQQEEDFRNNNEKPQWPVNVKLISLAGKPSYRSALSVLPPKIADALHSRLLRKSLKASANSYFLKAYPALKNALEEIQPDCVLLENLEAVNMFAKPIKKLAPTVRIIYDAHNVDSVLWKQLAAAKNDPLLDAYAGQALDTEKALYKITDKVFCCSEPDRSLLTSLNDHKTDPVVIPNGVDCALKKYDDNPMKFEQATILFCGSLEYYPNEEGFSWFLVNVFPLIKNIFPSVRLVLVGSENIPSSCRMIVDDPAINVAGRVDDVAAYYYSSSVCIAPLLSGSGTRLKILEAMSFGNPVVSTTIGAEGIEAENGKHILTADKPEEFAGQIQKLLTDKTIYNTIRETASTFVKERYDWANLGTRIDEAFSSIKKSA